jgi:hypothetical protein
MAACQSTLGLYDLLVFILVHVEPADLLQAKRVSRLWRDAIEDTSQLRQCLFLEALPSTYSTTTNPWLQTPGPLGEPTKLAIMGLSSLPESFHRPQTSWRKIFATQPPSISVVLEFSHKHVFQCVTTRREICNPTGVTLEDYVNALVEASKFASSKLRWVQFRLPELLEARKHHDSSCQIECACTGP